MPLRRGQCLTPLIEVTWWVLKLDEGEDEYDSVDGRWISIDG